jgi:hypothetical protein
MALTMTKDEREAFLADIHVILGGQCPRPEGRSWATRDPVSEN